MIDFLLKQQLVKKKICIQQQLRYIQTHSVHPVGFCWNVVGELSAPLAELHL